MRTEPQNQDTQKRLELFASLHRAGNFLRLKEETDWRTAPPASKLTTARYHALACRYLNEGEAANVDLREVSRSIFVANADQVSQLAEELIECCAYREAVDLIGKLNAHGAPHARYLSAVLHRIYGDWTAFFKAAEQVAAMGHPWVDRINTQIAWARLSQGRLNEARQILDSFSKVHHPGLKKLSARLMIAQGSHSDALNVIQAVETMQPGDWEWPALKAHALAESNKSSKQDSVDRQVHLLFEVALARQPAQPEALYNRAQWWLRNKEPKRALHDINQALKLMPWYEAPLLLWISHLCSDGDFTSAQCWLDARRQDYDSGIRAGAALDILRLSKATRDEVLTAYKGLSCRHQRDSQFLRAAGAALQSVGLLDKASACYAQALEITPADFGSLNNLAVLERDRGDGEAAVARWRQLLETGVFNDAVLLNLGHVLRERGDHGDAQRYFDAVLNRQPQNPSALRGCAEVAFAAGDLQMAWEYASRSLEFDRTNPLAWKTAAGVAARRDGPHAAQYLIEQGISVAKPPLELHRALLGRLVRSRPPTVAVEAARGWLSEAPQKLRIEYLLMVADAELEAGHLEDCELTLRDAVSADISKGSQALIRFYESRGREGAARKVAEQLVSALPQEQRHWGLLAEVLYRQERYDQALDALRKGLDIDPDRLSLRRQQVAMFLERERHEEALEVALDYARRVPLPPQMELAVGALFRANRPRDAAELVRKRLEDRPKDRALKLMLASCLRRIGEWQESLVMLSDLYAQEPGNVQVARQYVSELVDAGRPQEALDLVHQLGRTYDKRPDLQEAVIRLLLELGQVELAREHVQKALRQRSDNINLWRIALQVEKRAEAPESEARILRELMKRFAPDQWMDLAKSACIRLGMVDELQQGLNAWRAKEPESVAPWWAAYAAARELRRFEHAHIALDKIEQMRGPRAEVHAQRASLLNEDNQLDQSIAEQRKAIALKPDTSAFYEALLNYLVKAGQFDEFDTLMGRIEHLLGDRRYAHFSNFFFNINCHPTWTSEQIWRFYSQWYQRAVRHSLPPIKPWTVSVDPQRRVRIGYLSPDFRRHVVAYFSEPLLCHHDREQFEVFAYAHLENDIHDNYTARFKSYADHWVPVQHLNDIELDRRIREDRIDILVDLAGHTTNNRLGVMLRKPAPLQVSWVFGAGQTTGLPQVDYLAGDAVTLPPSFEACVAEKIIRLPTPGLPFRPADDHLPPSPLPTLATGRVVLGVLARPLRINRNCISAWSQILMHCPTAVIRFDHVPYTQEAIQKRIVSQFAEHGIDAARVLFANTRPHWQALSNIDLQLDPFPAGSGTVVSEGLWMERLAVTLSSRPPMGLTATAQLRALGLDDWCVAKSVAEYIDKTITLVNQPERLAALSSGMRQQMLASSLMDYERYGRESAVMYRKIWGDWCAMQSSARAFAERATATSS